MSNRWICLVMLGALAALSYCGTATAQAADGAPAADGGIDLAKEVANLKKWKLYLEGERDKQKKIADEALLQVQAKDAEIAQLKTAAAAAQAQASAAATAQSQATAQLEQERSAAATAAATAATAAAAAAQAQATLQQQLDAAQQQLSAVQASAAAASADAERVRKEAADAASRADAQAAAATHYASQVQALQAKLAAAEAAGGEAAALRARVGELEEEHARLKAAVQEAAASASQFGGLRGHTRAIVDIMMAELNRHKDTAVSYANEKLPGLQAKVSEVHAQVSARVPDVSRHVGGFVGRVDAELRPFLAAQLGAHAATARYAADPVVLQALVYGIIAAPAVLLLPLLLSCCCRRRRPAAPSRPDGRPGRKGPKGAKRA